MIRKALASLPLFALLLTGCSSGHPSYKTMTCPQWLKLADSNDTVTNGTLDVAGDYLNSTTIDPVHGASDIANFADTISGACRLRPFRNMKIIDLKPEHVAEFLSEYPEDRG